MSDGRNHASGSISLPGLLAGVCGLGLAYAYFKFPQLSRIGGTVGSVLVIVVSTAMTLWGFRQVFRETARESTGRNSRREPVDANAAKRPRIAWFGVMLILVGSELIYATFTRTVNQGFLIAGTLIGGILILAGLREFVRTMTAVGDTGKTRTYMLTTQGGVFLLMMCVIFVGSLIGRSNMLLLVFALMVGPFVAGGWMTFTMLKKTKVRRVLPKQVMAGDRVSVQLILENNKKRLSSWLMDVSDQISGCGETLFSGVLFSRVPPRSERQGRYELRLMRRGLYKIGPITLTTRFPLGFVERGRQLPITDEIVVFPRIGEFLPAWRRKRDTVADIVHQQNSRPGIYDDEFHRLREFRWGDNPRAIHWRTSARRNELMVREFQQTREQDLTILLDLWLPEAPTDDDWERVELAVSFAATLGVEQMRESRESKIVMLIAGQTESRWEGRAGPTGFQSFLKSLAVVQPSVSPNRKWLTNSDQPTVTAFTRTILVSTRVLEHENAPEDVGVRSQHMVENDSGVEAVVIGSSQAASYFRIVD